MTIPIQKTEISTKELDGSVSLLHGLRLDLDQGMLATMTVSCRRSSNHIQEEYAHQALKLNNLSLSCCVACLVQGACLRGKSTPEARMKRGQATFLGTCVACHQQEGQGLANVFPPLAKSDYLMEDKERSIKIVLEGLTGPIEVNGSMYNGVMAPLGNLTDHEIAEVLAFVRNKDR